MTKRTKTIDVLIEYFDKKGRVLTAQEYTREDDTPIRFQQIRQMFGSWGRMEKILMARREFRDSDEPITNVNEVIAERNKAQLAAEKAWKEASENQDKKVAREAEAQVVAEKLAANAATPEGANANKIAIGGPLPHEQPQYELRGATVNIDPATRERTVVDPEPELMDKGVEGEVEAGDSFETAKAKAQAKQAAPKVGHATDGGTSATPSVATAAALGDAKTADKDTTKDSDKAKK